MRLHCGMWCFSNPAPVVRIRNTETGTTCVCRMLTWLVLCPPPTINAQGNSGNIICSLMTTTPEENELPPCLNAYGCSWGREFHVTARISYDSTRESKQAQACAKLQCGVWSAPQVQQEVKCPSSLSVLGTCLALQEVPKPRQKAQKVDWPWATSLAAGEAMTFVLDRELAAFLWSSHWGWNSCSAIYWMAIWHPHVKLNARHNTDT